MQNNSKLIVSLFNFLSSCGFREQLIGSFAFHPPRVSYVLILREGITQKRKMTETTLDKQYNLQKSIIIDDLRMHRVSCVATEIEPREYIGIEQNREYNLQKSKSQENIQGCFTEENNIDNNKKDVYSPSMVQYKDEPYIIQEYVMEESKSQDQIESRFSFSTRVDGKFYRPKNKTKFPVYDILLVKQDGGLVEIEKQENLNIHCYFLKTSKGQSIASVFIEIENQKSDYCLLFSHGNATDLGYMLDTYLDLAYNLNINVFAYEYSGYGQSSGKCSDLNMIQNIKLSYKFLTQELGFPSTKIISYGYSIGSGPSVALAALENYPLGGLVIHSGLSSGLRVVNTNIKQTPYNDFFPNLDLMKSVTCPVFIMHGTNDEKISIDNAVQLSQNCTRLYELWVVENAGHSGIDTQIQYRISYFQKLNAFLQLIYNENQLLSAEKLEQRNTANKPRQSLNHYYTGRIQSYDSQSMSEFCNNQSQISEFTIKSHIIDKQKEEAM